MNRPISGDLDDGAPPPPPSVRRNAMELLAEELQAECQRYGISASDTNTRMNALQLKYDDEYETVLHEYEQYQQKLHRKKIKQEHNEAVQGMKELEQVALLRDTKTTAIVEQIHAHVAPRHLAVRGISPLACCALLRALRINSNVLTLDLSNNHLDDLVSEALAKMLTKNTRLRALNIGFNAFTCHTLGPLGRALQTNTVLTSLSLESTPIMANTTGTASSSSGTTTSSSTGGGGAAGAGNQAMMLAVESFMKAIATSTTLTSLNLFNTQMTFDVGRAVARALENNHSLVVLEIGGNAVTQTDQGTIACKLQKNQSRQLVAQDKDAQIRHEIKQSAEAIHQQNEKRAKQHANAKWHDANAAVRAAQREKDEWERARLTAEEDVRVALEIEAQQKQYLQQLEDKKNAKPSKGKK